MSILQDIFRDHYEEMIYTLHPRDSVIENVDKMHIAKFNGRFYGVKRPHSEGKRPENISLIHCARP